MRLYSVFIEACKSTRKLQDSLSNWCASGATLGLVLVRFHRIICASCCSALLLCHFLLSVEHCQKLNCCSAQGNKTLFHRRPSAKRRFFLSRLSRSQIRNIWQPIRPYKRLACSLTTGFAFSIDNVLIFRVCSPEIFFQNLWKRWRSECSTAFMYLSEFRLGSNT
jgi:hypothetical protein